MGRVVVVVVAVRGSSLVVYCVVLALYEEVQNTVYRVKCGLFRSFDGGGCCACCIGVLVALWRW